MITMIERLPYEPGSLVRAKALGGAEWLGWDLHASKLAEVSDRVLLAAKAMGGGRARVTASEQSARPTPSRGGRPRSLMSDLSSMMT